MSLLETKQTRKLTGAPTQKSKLYNLLRLLGDKSSAHSDAKIADIARSISSLFDGIPEGSFLLWAVSEEMERISYDN